MLGQASLRIALLAIALPPAGHAALAQSSPLVPFTVVGDAIPAPLGGLSGNAPHGAAVVADPERGNCTICHVLPGGDQRVQGNIGPPLAGIANRRTTGQLRLRLVDGQRINPSTLMPPYYRIDDLTRVASQYAGKPVLSAAEIEDVVAYLATLKD